MFVSDSNIFPSSKMKLRITCQDGTNFVVAVTPDSTVDSLKVATLSQMCTDPSGSMKESLYHRMVLVRTCKALEDDKSLDEQGVMDNDEILLLKRRLCPSQFDKTADKKVVEAKQSPSAEDICNATADVMSVEYSSTVHGNLTTSMDFQAELRKILISLIEVSQKLLCLNPEASKIFQQAEEILNEPSQQNKIDERAVKHLTEMGFQENRARKALYLNKSVVSATEWLLQHDTDDDIDKPLEELEQEETGATGGSHVDMATDGQQTSPCRVSNILQSLRAYRKREFKPNQKVLQHLMEMGFDETDVIDALRANRNDGDAACEMLLSNRKPPPEDSDDGIEHDSPLFKAIMANPTVQLGLNNPRCLLAFIQMLEHPNTASQWLNDPETAPLLVQVSRIYYAEKNSELQKNHESQLQKKKTSR